MKRGLSLLTASSLALVIVAGSSNIVAAQKSGKYTGPETGLMGIKLFDSGLKVLQMYGNPDSISAISVASAGGGGGQGGPPSGFGGGAPSGGPPSGGGTGPSQAKRPPSSLGFIPGGLLDDPNAIRQGASPSSAGFELPAGPPGGGGGGGSAPTGGGGRPGGGAPGGSATESAIITRWNYTRNGTKFAFVIDKFNRVMQIEAIGLENARVKTRRGIGFGSTFRSVMGAYAPQADPDGYDISGNNITVRFLTRHRVVFRLSQLSTKKSHVVTGIVVAAGKQ